MNIYNAPVSVKKTLRAQWQHSAMKKKLKLSRQMCFWAHLKDNKDGAILIYSGKSFQITGTADVKGRLLHDLFIFWIENLTSRPLY